MSGKIINVFSNKGGVGKTTTTVNLAVALAKLGHRILVFGVDSQADITRIVLNEVDWDNDLSDLLNDRAKIEDCIYPSSLQAGLFCIPSSPEIVALEPKLISKGSEAFGLIRDKIRDYAINHFDITLIDNPPNHGVFVIGSNYASDFAIVPIVSGSKLSMMGLNKAFEFISDIQKIGNPDLKFLKMLMRRTEGRGRETTLDTHYAETLKSKFPGFYFDTIIPGSVDFRYAEEQSASVFNLKKKPSNTVKKAYMALADEVVSILGIAKAV